MAADEEVVAAGKRLVCIFGATGQLGFELIKEALLHRLVAAEPPEQTEEAHMTSAYRVRAIVRNRAKLEEMLTGSELAAHPDLEIRETTALAEGEAEGLSAEAEQAVQERLHELVRGSYAVMSALGSPPFKESRLMSRACHHISHALTRGQESAQGQQQRFLYCSSWGSGAHFEAHDAWLYRFFVNWIIYQPLQDHFRSETFLSQFAADHPNFRFISVRPPGLTTGPRTQLPFQSQANVYSLDGVPHRISRADVARFFFDCLNSPDDPAVWNAPVAVSVRAPQQ